MSDHYTFLQLAQEFGGTRFGPFQGVEIRLGSDPGRNDITLPETLGVSPEHLKVLIQTDGSYILAPIERTAAVFFWRNGSTRSKQIGAPMAVQAGDGFSLVSPEGPRFYIQMIEKRQEAQKAAEESEGPGFRAPAGLTGSGLWAEIRRRGFATVFASSIGNFALRAWTFVKTGQAFQPRYVIAGMMIVSGWVFAGGAGCGALSLNSSKAKSQKQLTDCRDQLGVGDPTSGGGDPTVAGLTQKILNDRSWQNTIDTDKELYDAYAKELRIIFGDPARYKRAYSNPSGAFARFKAALEAQGLPPNLVRVMAYAAALPGHQDRDWSLVEDSDGNEVCGRGPLGLTYAQAYRLGLSNVQLDAMFESQEAGSNDLQATVTRLEETAARIGAPTTFDHDLVKGAGVQLQGGVECKYVDGDDDRDDIRAVAAEVSRRLGPGARGLPGESDSYWIASRVVKLYAMDFRRGYDDLDFDPKRAPSVAMADVKSDRKDYAIREAAATIARAVAVPCLARLDKEVADSPPDFMGELPNLGNCAIVKAFVEYDRL